MSAHLDGPAGSDIENYLDSALYREDDLAAAHRSQHEVMLYCESYVAIPVAFLNMQSEPDSPRILLLNTFGDGN